MSITQLALYVDRYTTSSTEEKKNSDSFSIDRINSYLMRLSLYLTCSLVNVSMLCGSLEHVHQISPNMHVSWAHTHQMVKDTCKKVNKKMISKLIDDIFNITFSWVRLRLSHWQTVWCAFFALSSKKLMYFCDRKHETCSTAYKLCCTIRNIQQVRFCHGVNLRDDELFLVYYL